MIAEPAKPRDSGTVDLRDLLRSLREHAGVIAACVAVSLAGAACYLMWARPVYSARALLEVAPQDARQGDNSDTDASDTLHTIELKIASQSVLLGVIRNLHLADDPDFAPPGRPHTGMDLVQRLSRRISAQTLRGSRLIALTAEDHSPEQARRLAQGVIDEFFRQSWSERSADASSARDLLRAEAARVGAETTAAEDRLQAYREQHHTASLEDRQNIVVERLRDLNQQAAAAKGQRMAMQSDAGQIKRLSGSEPERLLAISGIASQPEIVDLRKELSVHEAEVATLAQRFGPLHPTMIQAQSELRELHAALDAAIRKAASLELQSYATAEATETALEGAVASQERAALELERTAIPYHALEREVQADSTMYQSVLDRLQQSDVSHGLMTAEEAEGDRIGVVEPPLTPLRPVRPSAKLWLALAAAAGLFVGGGVAAAARALDNTISSVDAAEEFLGLPVLASVPEARRRRLEAGPILLQGGSSPAAEAFRSLRTSLSLFASGEEKRVVLFTSAVPGEGKSYCSMNYATALAQRGWRTLLIDGDLRRPHQQEAFAVAGRSRISRFLNPPIGKPGLAACLKEPEHFDATVQATAVPKLFLLGDAQSVPGGGDLLACGGFEEILQRGLAAYDRVVIDSAPLIAVSDALHIAKLVPTICLVARAGMTPRRLVRRACRLLEEVAGREPAGLILNRVALSEASADRYYTSDQVYA